MPFISASAITPYNSIRGGAAGGALDPILAYSPFNVWDSEHVTIDGDVTTLLDYNNVGAAYDLANPAASNQPTYNASSSDFNSLPSFTFDGIADYVINSVNDFRGADTSGFIVSVFKLIGGYRMDILTSASESVNFRFVEQSFFGSSAQYSFRSGGAPTTVNSMERAITVGDATIQGLSGDGTNFVPYDEAGEMTFTLSDSYRWFDGVTGRENIAIGGWLRPASGYSNIEWCFSGYFPYVDDATTLEIIAILKTKYAI